jgi:hypothetical protein
VQPARSPQARKSDPRAWSRPGSVARQCAFLDHPCGRAVNTRRCPQPDCGTSNFCTETNRAHLQSCEEILRFEEPVWFPKFNAVNPELLMFCALWI